LPQLLSNYIKLLTEVVGLRSTHLCKVIAIRQKLRQKVDLYINMGPREILFLFWAIFLDAREVFSQQIEDTDAVPESQLKYTMSFLGVGAYLWISWAYRSLNLVPRVAPPQ
jgi:hypothetical protein